MAVGSGGVCAEAVSPPDVSLSVCVGHERTITTITGDNMQTHWFYVVWAFIGVGGAIVMVAVLLTTDTFRSNTTVSRWRDLVWLAWLAVPLYLLHQFEEYSLPTLGLDYSIQNM